MGDPTAPEVLRPGRLLVANPLLPDPNFDRTVVMLLAYSQDGALGLVLNRPSETGVGLPMQRWGELAATPAVLFVGGPVQHQAVICLARTEASLSPDPALEGFKPLTPELATLDLDLDPDRFAGQFRQVRVFAGYAGWPPGQPMLSFAPAGSGRDAANPPPDTKFHRCPAFACCPKAPSIASPPAK